MKKIVIILFLFVISGIAHSQSLKNYWVGGGIGISKYFADFKTDPGFHINLNLSKKQNDWFTVGMHSHFNTMKPSLIELEQRGYSMEAKNYYNSEIGVHTIFRIVEFETLDLVKIRLSIISEINYFFQINNDYIIPAFANPEMEKKSGAIIGYPGFRISYSLLNIEVFSNFKCGFSNSDYLDKYSNSPSNYNDNVFKIDFGLSFKIG